MTMAINNKIARQIAKQAALETYKALVNAPVKKIASTTQGVYTGVDIKAAAKAAAAATYNTIVRLAQNPGSLPTPNSGELERNLTAALGMRSPVVTWYGNHYRGTPTQGIDPEAFKADFAKLPTGNVTAQDKEYLRGEVVKAFGQDITGGA
jgi:hypothetical protein